MKRPILVLSGLAVLASLSCGQSARAGSDSGLDERIRILQEAFGRFEKDRQALQATLKAEQQARKEAEAALTKALKQVSDLEKKKEDAELRGEEAAQVIEGLQTARAEAARAAKEQEKAIRRLETESERLRALNESLDRKNRNLQDQLAMVETEPVEKPAKILPPPVPEPVTEPVAEPAASEPESEPSPKAVVGEGQAPSLESARKLIGENKFDEAEAMLIALANTRRPDPAVLAELGRVQMKQKQFPSAVQTLQEAVRREPKNPAILKDLALACHGNKQLPEAIRYLSKVVELNPKDGEAQFNLAALCLMLPNPRIKDAAAYYEKALKLGEPRDEKLEAILFK